MKKVILILGALFCTIGTTYAQWTNSTDIYNTNTGNVGIGTTTPASLFSVGSLSQFQINTSGLTSLTNTTPEFRFISSADGSFARFLRGSGSSNNFFAGKNQVAQAGGNGNAISLFNGSLYTGSDAGLPTGASITLSVSMWLKGNGFNSESTVFGYGGTASSSLNLTIGGGYAGMLYLGQSSEVSQGGDFPIDVNWHHLVFVINGTLYTIYIDGVLNFSTYISYNPIALNGVMTNGIRYGYPSFISEANYDQLLVYNTALSATDVANIYNGGAGTITPPTTGLIRRYESEEGTGNTTADSNPNGTQYPLTLTNSYVWNTGIVPLSSTPAEVTYFSSADGVTNGEKGIATWGDFNGRNQQQGKWFQWFQGTHYPLVSNNSGQWVFNPNNTSTTLPNIASTVDVAGNITIGSGYAGVNAAPANGLLVQGNVGIGTTSPGQKLDVLGNIRIPTANSIFFDSASGSNIHQDVAGSFNMNASTAGGGNGNIVLNAATGGGIYLNFSSGSNVFFGNGTSGTTGVIQSNGSIGIGTTNTYTYKLAVAGSAIAESMTVKLQANWPDYVFKPNYTLPSLTEVKTYIDKNQHLPELPSEQEITEKGLNLGEMNKLLVKKVEELTLYLIEKDNEVKEQDKINQSQQQQIDELKKQVEALITICSKTK